MSTFCLVFGLRRLTCVAFVGRVWHVLGGDCVFAFRPIRPLVRPCAMLVRYALSIRFLLISFSGVISGPDIFIRFEYHSMRHLQSYIECCVKGSYIYPREARRPPTSLVVMQSRSWDVFMQRRDQVTLRIKLPIDFPAIRVLCDLQPASRKQRYLDFAGRGVGCGGALFHG